MNKKQKIWLYISLGIFLLPEILWYFILSFLTSIIPNNTELLYLKKSLFDFSQNPTQFLLVFSFHLLGLIMLLGIVIKFKFKIKPVIKTLLITSIALLIIIMIFLLNAGYVMRHGIGF